MKKHQLICDGMYCECGADTYVCQVCGHIHCDNEKPPIWAKLVDGKFHAGNICPKCQKEHEVK